MIKFCQKCQKKYYYDVDKCIFCFFDVEAMDEHKEGQQFQIKSVTEVKISSLKDTETPYFVAFMENATSDFRFTKTFSPPGAEISPASEAASTNIANLKAGIIGTGAMGEGIAHWILQKGGRVVLVTRSEEKISIINQNARKYLESVFDKEKIEKMLCRFTPSTDISLVRDADIVIESVAEKLEIKQELFAKLDVVCPPKTILVTNTSSLSVNEIAAQSRNRSRLAGLHFFNPVKKMKLVEIVKTKFTSPETLTFLLNFCQQLDKKAVVVNDTPGFIVNRILFPYLLEACHLLELGMAKEDIDSSAQLGLNHPIGPLALIDFIGLDVFEHSCQNLFQQTGDEKWKVPEMITRMVQEGKLGYKSKEGFYRY